MVQEPRTAIGKVVLDLPAGIIEEGEDIKDAAIRELEEEKEVLLEKINKLCKKYYNKGVKSGRKGEEAQEMSDDSDQEKRNPRGKRTT